MNFNAIALPRRYPGLKPFERSQQAVFHGRQEDVQRLSHLVLRERLVVLFAKSGIGKTSLLQAGVAPELERQDYVPIMLRTDRTDRPILESLTAILTNAPELSGRNTTGERPGQPQTLWELMKRLEFDLNGLPATPVLVFDQFEEAFTLTHGEKSRNQFLTEVADLANGTMPETLRSELLASFQAGGITMETMQWWEQQPDLRMVMSIRSDFLHMLDGMSGRIPGILKNRYQLLPLDREKTRTAIVMPASASGEFSSPPFRYTEAALTEMIDFLAGNNLEDKAGLIGDVQGLKRKDEIEAVNLQIVCMDVEERIIDYQKPADFEVVPEFYDGQEGLRSSIRNFYANQLNAFPKAYVERMLQKSQQATPLSELDKTLTAQDAQTLHDQAQRLIEESLITPGNRRNSVVDDTLLDEHDVTVDFLDTLVDKSRLLRKEPRLDDFYYEISHDTLLPAIIESRNRRRDKEKTDHEKIAFEAKLAEEATRREAIELELKTTRRQRKLARTVALLSFISLLVSLAFGIWFIKDYVESAHSQLETAEQNVSIEQYDAALNGYDELGHHPWRLRVLRFYNPAKDIQQEISIVDSLHIAYTQASDSLRLADGLMMFNDSCAQALSAYRSTISALHRYKKLVRDNPLAIENGQTKPRVDTSSINRQLDLLTKRKDNALQTLIREFKISQRDYEVFNEAKVWGQALRNLQRMDQLLPEHPEDQQVLQKALQLNTPIDRYVRAKIWECRKMIYR